MRVPNGGACRLATCCAALCVAFAQAASAAHAPTSPLRGAPADQPVTLGQQPPTGPRVILSAPQAPERPNTAPPRAGPSPTPAPAPRPAAPEPAPAPEAPGGKPSAPGGKPPPSAPPPKRDTDGEDAPPLSEAAEAARFLMQASFGPAPEDVAAVSEDGPAAWIAAQAALPVRPYVDRIRSMGGAGRSEIADLTWARFIEADDQLRHRVAYALSKIVTASLVDQKLQEQPEVFAAYMDTLQRQALGNYEDLIREVTYSPAMGLWLSHLGNRKADPETGIEPDENYAREVMQLFTIGLVALNPNGIERETETYSTDDVRGLAAILTGLSWDADRFEYPNVTEANRTLPMIGFPDYHEPEAQDVLGRTVGGTGGVEADVDAALDALLAHPNLAPFLSRQVIQHLVSSNPTPGYVARVAAAFEAGAFTSPSGLSFGEGRRGDMLATVAAILLDQEARDTSAALARPEHGKLREPVLRFAHLARAYRDDGGARGSGQPESVGVLRYPADLRRLGQAPYAPPSVFGWFRPGYVVPGGWTSDAGLVAPEMQLAAGSALPGLTQFMSEAIENRVGGTDFFDLDLSALEAEAEDPAALVAAAEAILTPAGLTTVTRERITETVAFLSVDDRDPEGDRRKRAEIALFMLTTSPEYAVQR